VITVKLGANRLVGADKRLILAAIDEILVCSKYNGYTEHNGKRKFDVPPLWDDQVAVRIVDAILKNRDLLLVKPQESFR
jgi:UDP-N-acetylglucosamine 2-epimerase